MSYFHESFNLPDEYLGAIPIGYEHVDLTKEAAQSVGDVINDLFEAYDWKYLLRKTYILNDNSLLFALYFRKEGETHYFQLPHGEWGLKCIVMV